MLGSVAGVVDCPLGHEQCRGAAEVRQATMSNDEWWPAYAQTREGTRDPVDRVALHEHESDAPAGCPRSASQTHCARIYNCSPLSIAFSPPSRFAFSLVIVC